LKVICSSTIDCSVKFYSFVMAESANLIWGNTEITKRTWTIFFSGLVFSKTHVGGFEGKLFWFSSEMQFHITFWKIFFILSFVSCYSCTSNFSNENVLTISCSSSFIYNIEFFNVIDLTEQINDEKFWQKFIHTIQKWCSIW
jgi:hypothetical protein